MASQRTSWIAGGLAFCLAAGTLLASEYRGTIRAGGLPLPGATVTATRGDQKLAATTDERGLFRFADLSDGAWTLAVEMVGFQKMTRDVGVAADAPAPVWDLQYLSEQALLAGFGEAPAAAERAATQRPAFRRVDVNQSANSSAAAADGALKTEEVADLTQNAANSFLVQGSMSSALGLGTQNDWGPRGMEMGGGPGGPGGPGPGGMGDGPPGGDGGGRGGRGGPGGAAFSGGPGGGGPGGGGPGGGGPGGGFGGGPGGPGGGGPMGGGRSGPPPGGPDWMGRPNAMAFGNGRRNPNNSYQFGANFSLDNSALDARSFSVTGANLSKPAYANGRGGLNFGGPLRIPHLVSASRQILFSVNYQFNRNRTGSDSNPVNMPTALERSGIFTTTIYDPATGAPFPNNQVPANRINAASAALLAYFPLPNLPYATRNYQTSLIGRNDSQNLNARLSNIKLDAKDRLNFGLGYQGSSSITPNLLQFSDTGSGSGINANLAWSHTFATHLTNNLQYTFSRMRQQTDPYFANRSNVAAELGILGTSASAGNWGPPNLSFTNYGSLSDGTLSRNRNQTATAAESLIWVHGAHNLTFGGDYRRLQFNQFSDSNGRGSFTFNGSATSLLVNGVAQSGTGYDLADFLLGAPTTASIRYGNPDKYLRGSGYDGFVNDDWRITSRLTLMAGLRWEYASPVTEKYDRLVNLLLGPGDATVQQLVPGQRN